MPSAEKYYQRQARRRHRAKLRAEAAQYEPPHRRRRAEPPVCKHCGAVIVPRKRVNAWGELVRGFSGFCDRLCYRAYFRGEKAEKGG